ncbi:hypothetical protein KSP40_PGU011742 [Platanthera guangdongensis]|uniref:Uncharacterized protein n=1 Tax=Platanthera guangdongensis TaxID=2320717 RepID=A0ABR2MDB5_9ASPA
MAECSKVEDGRGDAGDTVSANLSTGPSFSGTDLLPAWSSFTHTPFYWYTLRLPFKSIFICLIFSPSMLVAIRKFRVHAVTITMVLELLQHLEGRTGNRSGYWITFDQPD